MAVAQTIIFGLVLGSYIAIAAIGFTLIYGIINLIDIAYAEYVAFGGLFGWAVVNSTSIPRLFTYPIVIIATAIFGLIVAKTFYRPLRDTGPVPLILTSIGVSYVLRNGFRLSFGSQLKFLQYEAATAYRTDLLGGLYINTQQIYVIGIAVLVFILIHLLLTRTTSGIAMRAISGNEQLASITGIDTDSIRNRVWILAAGLAGLAGFMIAVQRGVRPRTGFTQLLFIISAAILGGAGSAYGAIAGAYTIGLAMTFSVRYIPGGSQIATALSFAVLIVVLLVRPGGIAGVEVEA